MSPAAARWLLVTTLPAMPFAAFGIAALLRDDGDNTAGIVAVGAALVLVLQVVTYVQLYRTAFWRGRLHGLVTARNLARGLPEEPLPHPRPWDEPMDLDETLGFGGW